MLIKTLKPIDRLRYQEDPLTLAHFSCHPTTLCPLLSALLSSLLLQRDIFILAVFLLKCQHSSPRQGVLWYQRVKGLLRWTQGADRNICYRPRTFSVPIFSENKPKNPNPVSHSEVHVDTKKIHIPETFCSEDCSKVLKFILGSIEKRLIFQICCFR